MAKFSLSQLMNDKSQATPSGNNSFAIELIPIEQIEPSPMNNYSVDDVAQLKDSIAMNGLQQNLLVRKIDGHQAFELLSGHRRLKALKELHETDNTTFATIPCHITKCTDNVQAELQLIFANATARELTDYEKTFQAARLKELLKELRKHTKEQTDCRGEHCSPEKITGKTRDIIADVLNVSPSQMARMAVINKNLSDEHKEEFKQGNINITAAYELSKKPKQPKPLNLQPQTVGARIARPKQQTEDPEDEHNAEQIEELKELQCEKKVELIRDINSAIRHIQTLLAKIQEMYTACENDGSPIPYSFRDRRKHYTLAIKALEHYKKGD